MKIMICEGNTEKAKVIADLLNVYQFKLIRLTQSNELFRQVQTHKPAVIILDENFSNNSSKDVISKLRMQPAMQNIPIIVLSNNTGSQTEYHEYNNDTLFELMQEPFKIKHLRHCIDRWTTFRSLYVKQ